jgi:polysaccharide export outer membrane protein
MYISRLVLALLILNGTLPPALGQTRPPAAVAFDPGNLPAQKIGPSDLLAVSVYNTPELSRTVRVTGEGLIQLPMLKEKLTVAGLLPAEVEKRIGAALAAEGLLIDPVVTVTVVEYQSRPVAVAGAVKKPVTFQAMGPVRLLDALARAEGLAPEAGSEILVSKPGRDGEPPLVTRIPVKGLIDQADPALNIRIEGGEEIRVPDAGRIFVVGNVRKPGSYPVQDANGLSVMKALALSEGLMPFSSKTAYLYRREAGPGKQELAIELRKILDRKSPDVALEPNDILYVPDNNRKRLSITTLERILAFGTTTSSGLLVWGAAR